MAGYTDWNNAIIDYFTSGVAAGGSIYLSVNDDALEYIGNKHLSLGPDVARLDFIRSVQTECTRIENGRRKVFLKGVASVCEDGRPKGVAFLGVMVLAAHEMQYDPHHHIDGTNYFKRFNELLGLAAGPQSRPVGMSAGDEEPLWEAWNRWLESKGWRSTAQKGEGPHAYVNYPIEQALLRKDDEAHIEDMFRREFTSAGDRAKDESQLGMWLMRRQFSRLHLARGFAGHDPARTSAFIDSAFRVYQSVDWDQPSGTKRRSSSQKIVGGLIRSVTLQGKLAYRLLPRKPPNWKNTPLEVEGPDGIANLNDYKSGMFMPLWVMESPFPEMPLDYPVSGDPAIEQIGFPKRDFWILTQDADDPLGNYATWDKYPSLLGKKFILTVKGNDGSALAREVAKYKEEGLVGYEKAFQDPRGWVEFRGCMVLSRAWDCIVPPPEAEALYDALRPSVFASLVFKGGLKLPDSPTWIEGFPPELCIYGFEKNFHVKVTSHSGEGMDEFTLQEQATKPLVMCGEPGVYLIKAYWATTLVASKILKVIPWGEIEPSSTPTDTTYKLGGLAFQGPVVTREEHHG